MYISSLICESAGNELLQTEALASINKIIARVHICECNKLYKRKRAVGHPRRGLLWKRVKFAFGNKKLKNSSG